MAQEVTNFARFYGLFNRLPYNQCPEDTKCAFVAQASNGRTTSLRELKRWEYDKLCEQLEDLLLPHHERKKLRSRCLKLMQQYGIDTTDWNRINAFCKDARIAGKPFRYIGIDELGKLAIKLRMMIRKKRGGETAEHSTEEPSSNDGASDEETSH